MANKNFFVHNGLTVGPTTIDAVTGNTLIAGVTTITNTTVANSTTTGALIVAGGIGIGGNLFAGGTLFASLRPDASSSSTTWGVYYNTVTRELTTSTAGTGSSFNGGTVTSATTFISTVTVLSTANSVSTTTGALIVAGGVGIRRDVWIGGNLNITGTLNYGSGSIAPISIQEFTATSNQSVFTVTNGYSLGSVQVFANGVALGFSDFTASNGSTVVLNDPRFSGDIIRVVSGGLVSGGSGTTSSNVTNVVSVSSNTVLTSNNETIFATAPLTLTLPNATVNTGRRFNIKNLSSGQINIQTVNGQSIDDDSSGLTLLYKNSAVILISDGNNWYIF